LAFLQIYSMTIQHAGRRGETLPMSNLNSTNGCLEWIWTTVLNNWNVRLS